MITARGSRNSTSSPWSAGEIRFAGVSLMRLPSGRRLGPHRPVPRAAAGQCPGSPASGTSGESPDGRSCPPTAFQSKSTGQPTSCDNSGFWRCRSSACLRCGGCCAQAACAPSSQPARPTSEARHRCRAAVRARRAEQRAPRRREARRYLRHAVPSPQADPRQAGSPATVPSRQPGSLSTMRRWRTAACGLCPARTGPACSTRAREQVDPQFDCTTEAYDFPYRDEDAVPWRCPPERPSSSTGTCRTASLRNRSAHGYRRALVNHYMSAESLLPWRPPAEGTHMAATDYRDVVLVAGRNPHRHKGLEDLSRTQVWRSTAVEVRGGVGAWAGEDGCVRFSSWTRGRSAMS
jgi:hypothetical protein